MRIVESGYKIDLHIHSIGSRGKDKGKVAFNTIENTPILAERLNDNGVQMCAITDHDAFDYKMYRTLKTYEGETKNSIIKVFPGVEFSVEYIGDKGATVLHVIAIFNDENESKIQAISDTLVNEDGSIAYDTVLPDAEERISYKMPTFWKWHNLIHFAAMKNHLGIYPGDGGVNAFKDEIEERGLKNSKGAIQFPYEKVDLELIGRIAEWCGMNN